MIYPISIFIDTIESIPGIIFLRDEKHDGVTVKMYQGLLGNLVMIDMTEEDIEEDLGTIYLQQLGLDEYVEALFPKERNQPRETENVDVSAEGGSES